MNSNPFLIDAYKILIYGVSGSGKTTAALAGEGRKAYMEMDIGSLQRAASSMQFDWTTIDHYQYRLPPTSLRDRGRVSNEMVGTSGKGANTIVHDLRGWDELAFRFTNEFCDFCEDFTWINGAKEKVDIPYSDIIVDTGTLLWDMLQDSTRERFQKAGGGTEKELKRLEFEEPNTQIWDMCNWAQANKKNLIFTSMESYVWNNSGPAPGYDYERHKPDGNKYLPGYVDVVLRMTVESRVPYGQLTKVAAGGLELLNMKISQPSVSKVIKILDTASMLKREGISLPDPLTADSLLAMAE